MRAAGRRAVLHLAAVAVAGTAAALATADVPMPPWIEPGEVAPPAWAQSVVRRADDAALFGDSDDPAPGPEAHDVEGPRGLVLFAEPSRASGRRGVSAPGASLPFFGTRRGSGCSGAWWLVGPLAWTCSDDAELSAESPTAPERIVDATGLASQYMFVRTGGASAYASLESAQDGEADEELEGGWAVAAAEQRTAGGERWVRTTKGLWLSQDDLSPVRPSAFQGEKIDDGKLDLAWVLADRASVWAAPPGDASALRTPVASGRPKSDKPSDVRARFQVVHVRAENGPYVQISDGTWMLASDLARPRLSTLPAGLAGHDERWIDVDSTSQTLVAYEGSRPVYATLVSTGSTARGPTDATPLGVHRIWVKILASDMGNVQQEDRDAHYSLEDVPYVQFFDNAVGLHGTYWHGDFGHPRSHGCVNLSPLDAHWMFDFTEPRLPTGWAAVYPTSIDPGTLVRVR